jgi:hypothetical protein
MLAHASARPRFGYLRIQRLWTVVFSGQDGFA